MGGRSVAGGFLTALFRSADGLTRKFRIPGNKSASIASSPKWLASLTDYASSLRANSGSPGMSAIRPERIGRKVSKAPFAPMGTPLI